MYERVDKSKRVSGFGWDAGNRDKCRKHGVPVAAIEALLAGLPRIVPDGRHSIEEDRFIAVGRDHEGRAMFVAFTLRRRGDGLFVRPISARYMHKKESDAYEKGAKADDG